MEKTLSRAQVLYLWALSESFSPRWKEAMQGAMSPGLRGKIAQGQAKGFSPEEGQELIELLLARRGHVLEDEKGVFERFKLITLPVEMLELLPVLPDMGWKDHPVLLGHFIDGEHDPAATDDPRACARRYAESPPPAYFTGYPILAYSEKLRCHTLLDGYSRCIAHILRKRAGLPVGEIPVIYCE